ncbi:hypothetical protein SAMN06264348_11038 [Oceanospirillum linum]|nr:hypothetical protein SAMN04489856_11095 [Oleiphilus messinensis]SMP33275.1 hypothetical protein SAMN06264348_11038 [Oceanospirillum linum]
MQIGQSGIKKPHKTPAAFKCGFYQKLAKEASAILLRFKRPESPGCPQQLYGPHQWRLLPNLNHAPYHHRQKS